MLIIDPVTQTAILKIRSGKESPVIRWEVWFQTPMGVTDDLAIAVGMCTDNDMPAQLVIRPVAVAIAEDETYEVIPSNH